MTLDSGSFTVTFLFYAGLSFLLFLISYLFHLFVFRVLTRSLLRNHFFRFYIGLGGNTFFLFLFVFGLGLSFILSTACIQVNALIYNFDLILASLFLFRMLHGVAGRLLNFCIIESDLAVAPTRTSTSLESTEVLLTHKRATSILFVRGSLYFMSIKSIFSVVITRFIAASRDLNNKIY